MGEIRMHTSLSLSLSLYRACTRVPTHPSLSSQLKADTAFSSWCLALLFVILTSAESSMMSCTRGSTQGHYYSRENYSLVTIAQRLHHIHVGKTPQWFYIPQWIRHSAHGFPIPVIVTQQ